MEGTPKVAVLMSTYNGSKYLKEQIESVLNQEKVEPVLFIRDDGSKDETVSIIKEYILSGNSDRIILEVGKNAGASKSFFELLYNVPSDYDYYAFCDQDDIWKEEKLIKAIEMLRANNKDVYCSNQSLVNASGEYLKEHYSKRLEINILEEIQENRVTGCTLVFTNAFFRMVTEPKRRPSEEFMQYQLHDMWFGLVASLLDTIIYDESSYILYRQHEGNVVGVKKKGRIEYFREAVKKIPQKDSRNTRSRRAKELAMTYPEYTDKNKLITACAYPERLKNKVELLKNYQVFKGHNSKLAFTLAVLFNFF